MEDHEISLREDGLDPSIEFLLILCCARTTEKSEVLRYITKLIWKIADWDYVLKFADEQGLLMFLLHNINLIFYEFLPQTIITGVRRRYASRSRSLLMEFRDVTSLFTSNGISAISYKGPTLAAIAYKNQKLRNSGDLDFLVHRRDYERVKAFLLAQGYVLSMDCGYKYHLWHPVKQVNLDLHRGLVPRWYKFTFSFENAWERAMPLAMPYGGSVPTFCLEDLVIVLSLDLVKDIAQSESLRLVKVTDIAELLKYHARINWSALTIRVKHMGLSRVTYFGLLLADRMYGVTLPPEVRQEMKSQLRHLRWPVNLAMRMMLDKKSSPRMLSPKFLHEARTIITLQDNLKNQFFVVALYLIRPIRLPLKYLLAVTNFVRCNPLVRRIFCG
jgi:Uncharacterised nucleotidyltransferase